MQALDFRSDTITQPTSEMRQEMARARVGDDVYGDDPTLNDLQGRVAELLGMEAALFTPTGTMANQLALWVHGKRDGQILCHQKSHISLYEQGGAAAISGVTLRTVESPQGIMRPDDLREHLLPDDAHFSRTRAIAIENTHNWAGGVPWTQSQLGALTGFAEAHDLPVHVDGARIWNAHIATGQSLPELTTACSSIMVCLSKGLSAPVGSLLVGDKEFIQEARRIRKVLGGGMRQAGHMAAAGIVALEHIPKLREDHANARRMANGLDQIPGLQVQKQRPRTNMVYADTSKLGITAEQFMDTAKEIGVLCLPRDHGTMIRFVTHRHVNAKDVDEAVARLKEVFS